MPKIREYGQALEYQAGGVTSTMGLARSGDVGRAIRGAGEEIGQLGDNIYKRQAQQETSDQNAQFSDLAADVSLEVDQGIQDGSIDAQKYAETVRQRIDKLGENISTNEGRMAYERNAARVMGQAQKMAARGQAAVAGAKAQTNLGTELSNYTSSLFTDPSEFSSNYDAMMSSINDQVTTKALKSADADKFRLAAGKDLAKSAVRGWAQLDPDIAEKKLRNGEFDTYLDGESKAQMQTYIDVKRSAQKTDIERKEALERKAEKAKGDAWMAKNLKGITAGTVSSDEILNAPGLKPQFKMQLLKSVQENAKNGGGITDPAVYTRISQRTLLPDGDPNKIEDPEQFIGLVGKGLSMKDFERLSSDLDKTPDGKAMRGSKKSAYDVAKAAIVQKSFVNFGSGQSSPESLSQLQRWSDEVRKLEEQYAKDGKPIRDLYDPANKGAYVGRPEFLSQFKTMVPGSPQYFSKQAQDTLSKQPAFGGSDEGKRKAGESAADYLKRTGGGG